MEIGRHIPECAKQSKKRVIYCHSISNTLNERNLGFLELVTNKY